MVNFSTILVFLMFMQENNVQCQNKEYWTQFCQFILFTIACITNITQLFVSFIPASFFQFHNKFGYCQWQTHFYQHRFFHTSFVLIYQKSADVFKIKLTRECSMINWQVCQYRLSPHCIHDCVDKLNFFVNQPKNIKLYIVNVF